MLWYLEGNKLLKHLIYIVKKHVEIFNNSCVTIFVHFFTTLKFDVNLLPRLLNTMIL